MSTESSQPLNLKLSGSRTVPPPGNGDHRACGSGVEDKECFGDEWLNDAEEEAYLHQMMDVLETSRENPPGPWKDSFRNTLTIVTLDKKISDSVTEKQSDNSQQMNSLCRCECETETKIETERKTLNVIDCKEKKIKNVSGSDSEKEAPAKSISTHVNTLALHKRIDGDTSHQSEPKSKTDTGCNNLTEGEGHAQPETKNGEDSKEFSRTDHADGITNDNKRGLGEDDIPDFMKPLRQFKGKYLWVSDLTSQAWCERRMLYELTMEVPAEALKMEIIEKEAKNQKVGSKMHLKRELEVHTIKKIAVTSREDKWAIKCLNIISSVNRLLQGGGDAGNSRCVIREMPIFGRPFQSGTFVVGVIDEIRYNAKDQLELVEFKTRAKARSIPSPAQRRIHKLQLMLYKQLFDEAVCGQLSRQTLLDTIRLDPEAPVGGEVAAHAQKLGLEPRTFGDILDGALDRFQFLPRISGLAVEYSSQADEAPFAVDDCTFDPVWLRGRLDYYNAFWEGRREAEGVDVEDTWKCNYCPYVNACDWRQKMHERLLSRNTSKRVKIEITD